MELATPKSNGIKSTREFNRVSKWKCKLDQKRTCRRFGEALSHKGPRGDKEWLFSEASGFGHCIWVVFLFSMPLPFSHKLHSFGYCLSHKLKVLWGGGHILLKAFLQLPSNRHGSPTPFKQHAQSLGGQPSILDSSAHKTQGRNPQQLCVATPRPQQLCMAMPCPLPGQDKEWA